MTDINIPPAAIEAAARALAIENETREDWWRFYEGKARAACLAMLTAWKPSWIETDCDNAGDIVSRYYVLDITPEENTNAEG